MAEETVIDFKINTANAATTVKDLKKSLKELKDELNNVEAGSAGFQKLTKSINDTEGKLGDLNDSFNTLTGSGVERAGKSFDLFKEGLTTFDFGKIKASLGGLSAAFSAIPIFLIVEGLKYLWDNFDKVAEVVKSFTKDVFGLSSASYDLERSHEKLRESTTNLTKSIDIQIQSLRGLKANDEEILALTEKKLKANILLEQSSLRVALAKQAEQEAEFNYNEQVLRLAGKNAEADVLRAIRTKEARDATNTAIESLKASIAGLSEFHNTQEQKKLDATAAANKKNLESHERMIADKKAADQKAFDDMFSQLLQEQQIIADQEKFRADERKAAKEKELADDQALMDAYIQSEIEGQKKQVEVDKRAEEEKRAEKQKTFDTTVSTTKLGLQATQALTDLYFAHQLRQAKGNAKAEQELRKKQFNVNKAFGVANSIIDGVGAVQKALNNPYPLNLILAVLTGVLATANTVKIATSKFDDGGNTAGSAGDIGGGSLSTGAAPAIPQPNNTVTQISDEGKVIDNKPKDQRVYVVETDIAESNKKVVGIEETAKI